MTIDPSSYDTLFANPAPSSTPESPTITMISSSVITSQCSLCGNITTTHPMKPAVCAVCAREAPVRLDALELAMVDAEERIAAAYWRFDTIMQHAKQDDRDRYQQVCEARINAVLDDGEWGALKRRIAKTIAQGDGLSAILKAEQERDAACREEGDAIARIREHQLALIGFALDWTPPNEAAERRKPISGQRPEPATHQVPMAI